MNAALLAVFLILAVLNPSDAQTGVNYGMLGNNLPSAKEVVSLYTKNNIKRMRIYAPDRAVFDALKGTDIKLMLDVSNPKLQSLASSQANAYSWVKTNVQPNPAVQYIIVGNEVRPDKEDSKQFSSYILPAMRNIKTAIEKLNNLGSTIKISTAFDMGVIGTGYPPSNGEFNASIESYLTPIIKFLADNNYPLMMNIYPYFAYASDTVNIPLNYALFTAPGTVVSDDGNEYQNLFSAQVDTVYSALENAGADSVTIVVSETGWPSDRGISTNVENARTYNNNLIRHVKQGTPKRPGKEVETYIFAMFDENQKSPDLEKHWGLFSPNKEPKYPISF